jgi:hypothetical protein
MTDIIRLQPNTQAYPDPIYDKDQLEFVVQRTQFYNNGNSWSPY